MLRSHFGIFAVATLCAAAVADEGAPLRTLLFDSGREGYPRYRIPALIVTPKGAVLAICEGRKDGGGLTGNIDIVLKRSGDNGRTWGSLQRVADDKANTLGNPCLVVDANTGALHLALTRSLGDEVERDIAAGKSRQTTRVLMTTSRDDGRSWSTLRDITDATKKNDWTWCGTGPGVGIQLQDGRLLIPSYHVAAGEYRSHVIYSDDHGRSWRLGGVVGPNTSECQTVQRRDGSLYLSARTVQGAEFRTVAESRDRGETWSRPRLDKKLHDPHCQACVAALPGDPRQRWLFSNPSGPGRHNLTVRVSRDEGSTWPVARRLHEGDSQYSCLAQLPDGRIGCLYESWRRDNYRIYFAAFALDWLEASDE